MTEPPFPFPLQKHHKRPIPHSGPQKKNSGPKTSYKQRFNTQPPLRQGGACRKGGGGAIGVLHAGSGERQTLRIQNPLTAPYAQHATERPLHVGDWEPCIRSTGATGRASPAARRAARWAATRAAGLAALLGEGLAGGLAALGAGLAWGLAGGSSPCGMQFALGTSRVKYNLPLAKAFASPHTPRAFFAPRNLCALVCNVPPPPLYKLR